MAGPLRRGPARRHRARPRERPGDVRRHACAARPTPSRSTTATVALTFAALDERIRRLRRGARAARRRARRPRRPVPAERPGVRRRGAGGVEARGHRGAGQPDAQGARGAHAARGLRAGGARDARVAVGRGGARGGRRDLGAHRRHRDARCDELARRPRRPDAPPDPGAGTRRRRLPDLHVGHDGASQGRDEHPRQRRLQLADLPRLGRRRRRRRDPRRRAALPHHRAHRAHRAVAADRRAARARPPLRRRAWRSSSIERHRVTFTTGAITAFIALMDAAETRERDTSSLRTIVSGGAPIAPATVEAFEGASAPTSTTSTG